MADEFVSKMGYPGYKPNPPRESEELTEAEKQRFWGFVRLLKEADEKNKRRGPEVL